MYNFMISSARDETYVHQDDFFMNDDASSWFHIFLMYQVKM